MEVRAFSRNPKDKPHEPVYTEHYQKQDRPAILAEEPGNVSKAGQMMSLAGNTTITIYNDIDHTMTKAYSLQTNGICERFL